MGPNLKVSVFWAQFYSMLYDISAEEVFTCLNSWTSMLHNLLKLTESVTYVKWNVWNFMSRVVP
jgi:hypothetical protein